MTKDPTTIFNLEFGAYGKIQDYGVKRACKHARGTKENGSSAFGHDTSIIRAYS
jgi:hypothetical protein